jgi:hypothetical protein
MEVLNYKEILTRKPWFRISPEFTPKMEGITNRFGVNTPVDSTMWSIYTQEDMLREYFPSGHKIRNKTIYPDVIKQDPDTGKWYVQPITRCSIAMQQILTTKQIIHICGNDVQFELANAKRGNKNVSEEDNNTLSLFKEGWLDKDMEIRFYEAMRSLKITSEACIVGWIENGKFGCKALSFLEDDILYPHYDSITGELKVFARQYFDYDDDHVAVTEWVEIWDDTHFHRAKRNLDTSKASVVTKIKDFFGLNGYEIVERKRHGFNFVPVAYYRENDGPCWSNSQDTIEHYEEAISYFFENNKAFAFPILVVSGDGVDINGDDMTGAVKTISIESADGNAKFLEGNDVSASYKTLLDLLYNTIYEESFAVKPPELKSGDLPGVALKLLYSPAIERAIDDSQRLQPFLSTLVHIVKYGYGLEVNQQASLLALSINAWIEPYVHQNDTELTTNLTTAVQNKVLSKQTASERLSKYAKNDEFDRIMREMKEANKMEIDKANIEKTHATDEDIRKAKATSKLNGSDINTGGGAGSGRQRRTDENGNWPGENNWNSWNTTH